MLTTKFLGSCCCCCSWLSVTRLGDFLKVLGDKFISLQMLSKYLLNFWVILKNIRFKKNNLLGHSGKYFCCIYLKIWSHWPSCFHLQKSLGGAILKMTLKWELLLNLNGILLCCFPGSWILLKSFIKNACLLNLFVSSHNLFQFTCVTHIKCHILGQWALGFLQFEFPLGLTIGSS